ncbi:sugar ABC transporter ATP-binding protein [Celeribacter sp.]|uniref:sugar ABC transporter ATP-binding protein n=1 Tax=Celeribacter sp. TaxID=1890673 RepID=UPI003A8D496B
MSVQLSDIIMEFPGTRALDRVSVSFRFDEVHGLVGENGAGKSTFVNVLGGSLQPTSGTIRVEGKDVVLSTPRAALGYGIAHVSQEGSLVPSLTGAENIMLGAEPRLPFGIMRRGALRKAAEDLLVQWFPGLEIDLDRPVIDLPMADQKVIEIVRALRGDIRLLILDEPTATLEAREKKQLWDIISLLPTKGVGVVLISHFLSEVVALSDCITVLRDGQHVDTLTRKDVTEAKLTDLMLRRDAIGGGTTAEADAGVRHVEASAPVVLSVENWAAGAVSMDHFQLRAGEIVGLIGLTGAGHFGFARSLYTRQGVTTGKIEIAGTPVTAKGVRAMQRAGVGLVPDHRMENALAGDGTVVENLTMVHPDFAARGGILGLRREAREADRVIQLLNVKTPSQRQLIRNLSGGNKQKVSIGKWLYGAGERYKVLIFIEPTEGVDIGAKMEIYAHMRRLAKSGAAILIASSDLGEIAQVCHRAIPFVHGLPGAEIQAADFSEGHFIQAITGDAA